VLVSALLTMWVLGRQQVMRMDGLFFQPSWAGVKGLAYYMVAHYGPAAEAYRAHFRGVVEAGNSVGYPWTDALLKGQPDEAERAANAVLKRRPLDREALLGLGEVALERGRPDVALEIFRKVLARAPVDPDAELLSSVAHARRGAYGDAITFARSALRSEAPERLTTFLLVLKTTGDLAMRRASDQPLCLLAHYHRYLLSFDPSHAGPVIRYAERAVKDQDHVVEALLAIGTIHERQRRLDRALAVFEKALATAPTDPELQWRAALVFRQRGDVVNEYRMARGAFDASPGDPIYLDTLDDVLMDRIGDPYLMVEVMERALPFSPNSVRVHQRLGYAYGFIANNEQALRHHRRAIELAPHRRKLWENLGWTLLRLGRPDEAVAAYQRAATVAPQHPIPHILLADVYRSTNRVDEAIMEYETALRLGADVGTHTNLCSMLYHAGDFQRALTCFQTVRPRDPGNPAIEQPIKDLLGMINGGPGER
jgi:tetratricopeptide (TPR) repeat protein